MSEFYNDIMKIVQAHRTNTGIGMIEDVVPYQVGDAVNELHEKYNIVLKSPDVPQQTTEKD
tara:strand:+ start:17702 stop:17884 length:183 start_codon:yes stop_codon:yes gene_type:complete